MTTKPFLPALAVLAMTAGSLVGGMLVVKDAKTGEMIAEVDPAAKTPVKIGELEVIIESKELSATEKKAKAIVIPNVDFDNVMVAVGADFLRQRIRELDTTELDPAKKGLNIRCLNREVEGATIAALQLRNATAYHTLTSIAEQAGLEVEFGEESVLFKPGAHK